MIKLLIADSDLYYAKKIISKIIKTDNRIRLVDIGTSTRETLNILKNCSPDIAIVNVDIIDITKFISISNIMHFILITENFDKADSTNYILKTGGIKLIKQKLNNIIDSNDFSRIKENLINILGKLKFDFGRVGTIYLIDAVMYCYEYREFNIYEKLESKVYPYISKKHNTPTVNIRITIDTAVNNMYDRNYIDNTLDNIYEFFYLDDKPRPTPKLVIIMLLRYLCEKNNIFLINYFNFRRFLFMVTLLIGDPDLKFAKTIISNIVRNNEKMRLIDITMTEEETINAIKEYTPHIAIINTDIVNMDLIRKLEHKPSIIPFTENDMKSAIKKYYLKSTNIKLIEKRVNELIIENDYAQTREEVVNIFSKLKFNFSRNGTPFLIDSILYCYEHKDKFPYENLERYVYPEVAKIHNTSAVNVKWVIVKAINEMYNRNCSDNTLDTVADFFYFTNKVKPTAKVIISTILARLEC